MVSSFLHSLPPISSFPPASTGGTSCTSSNEKPSRAQLSNCYPDIQSKEPHTTNPFLHAEGTFRAIYSDTPLFNHITESISDMILFILGRRKKEEPRGTHSSYQEEEQAALPSCSPSQPIPIPSPKASSSPKISQRQLRSKGAIEQPDYDFPIATLFHSPSNWDHEIAKALQSWLRRTRPKKEENRAARQKRPPWTLTHTYVRDIRVNSDELRMLSIERSMIKNDKLIRPLKNRRYLEKRHDEFVWGRRSCLRIVNVGNSNK